MKNNYFKVVFSLALFSTLLLLLNTLFYRYTSYGAQQHDFVYSLVMLYSFFYLLSAVIIGALNLIYKKNKEQLGYAFLFLTSAKLAISYFLAKPIIEKGEVAATEKINFFIVFIIFLIIEAYYTARLLNNKQ